MKYNKKYTLYLVISFVLLISFVLIVLTRSGFLFKVDSNVSTIVNSEKLDVSFKPSNNTINIDSDSDNLEYQVVTSDFDVVNNTRIILKDRDHYLAAYDKYIDKYKEELSSLDLNSEEAKELQSLIDRFSTGKTAVIEENNNKINKVLGDLSLSDSWERVENKSITVENNGSDKLIFVKDDDENYIYYSLESVEIPDNKQCVIREDYLKYLSLSDKEKENVEIIPDICEETNEYVDNSSDDSGVYGSKYPENFGTDEFFNTTHMKIKDQMSTPFCVMFSTMATLENYLYSKYHQHYSFSERYAALKMTRPFYDDNNHNQVNVIGYRTDLDHGFSNWSAAKLIGYYGPIYDDELAWLDSTAKAKISTIEGKVGRVDVNEIRVTNNLSLDEIKENVVTNGATKTGAYITTYDFKNKYYFYRKSDSSTHAITIIGWDDTIPKTMFQSGVSVPSSDGALIIKNSYGTYDEHSLNGYFYMSYSQFRRNYMAIQDADFDFNDNQYFYDFGVNVESGDATFQAIKITKNNAREQLKRIKYAVYNDTKVSIYYIPNGNTELKISNATKLAENIIVKAGIHTFDLDQPIELTNDTAYIIISATNEEDLAVQKYDTSDTPSSSLRNKMFYSATGSSFLDFSNIGYSPMIAAYTDNIVDTDTIKPDVQLHLGSEDKATSQSLLLQCHDKGGVTGYYFGTSNPSISDMTNTEDLVKLKEEGIIKNNITNGTYYLGCKDAAGNSDVVSVIIRKYTVNNYYEKIEATSTDVSDENYDLVSSHTYYIRDNGSFYPDEVHDHLGTFKGYSTIGNGLTTSRITVSSDNANYNMYFSRNKVTYTISSTINRGKITAKTVIQPNNEITVNFFGFDDAFSFTKTIDVKEGDTLKVTATPNSGYYLDSWNGAITGSASPTYIPYDYNTTNRNITASFSTTVTTHTVTFMNGDEVYDDVQVLKDGTPASQPVNPTNGDKKFKYWSTSTTGTAYDFSTAVTSDLTLYAIYEQDTYTVRFKKDGKNYIEPYTVTSGEKITAPTPNPEKDGYTFKYWSTKSNGTAYNFNTPVTSNITLYAVFEIKTYTVTFKNGNDTFGTPITVNHGETVTPPSTNPEQAGRTFTHWSILENGETPYNFSTAVTGNITLYAVFSNDTYTVTFKNGNSNYGSPITVNYGETVTAPSTTPKKDGYTFSYWSLTANGEAFDFTTPITKNTDLYAVYSLNELSLRNTKNMHVTDSKFYARPVNNLYVDRGSIFNNLVSTAEVKIYDKNNSEISTNSTPIGTGYKIKSGTNVFDFVIYGDVDQNAIVNTNDLRIIYKIITSSIEVGELNLEAADYDGDDTVTVNDLRNTYLLITK